MSEEIKDILNKFDKVLENYELDKKFKQFSIDSICHLFPNEMLTIKSTIGNQREEIDRLQQENQKLRDKIIELKEYEKAIYEIKKYIDAYSPYFLETQEQNNQTIATIIHNIGDDSDDTRKSK